MKYKVALITMGIMLSSLGVAYADNNFSDINGHWAQDQIVTFSENGYVNGYENNIFKPDGQITRAEFVSIFNKVFGLTQGSNKVFEDTKSHWSKNVVDTAVTNGVCSGKSDTNFAPDDKLTRQEASKMLSNYLQLADSNIDKLRAYKDNEQVASWAMNDVEGVIEKGYMKGYSSGEFKPLSTITRAETVTMLNRVLSERRPSVKPITPISFEGLASKLPSMGFNDLGAYWENGNKMGMANVGNNKAGFVLHENSASFNSTIKNCFNMLLPTKGNELYNIVSNPFEDQTLELDGRKVVIKQYPQGVSIEISNN